MWSPVVAATQFTAYMAILNLVITYTAFWQGVTIERWGYPTTLLLDAGAGLLCLVPLVLMTRVAPASDSA
jgi:PAT family beta-lactamase induction signal transducer AmpG